MHTYIKTEPGLWTVGHYEPSGKWIPASDHGSSEEAAGRAAWLNGSPVPVEVPEPRAPMFAVQFTTRYLDDGMYVSSGHVAYFATAEERDDFTGRGFIAASRYPEDDAPVPAGQPFPGIPGYVMGTDGHGVAASEWRAGFRHCERCGEYGDTPTLGTAPGDDEYEVTPADIA